MLGIIEIDNDLPALHRIARGEGPAAARIDRQAVFALDLGHQVGIFNRLHRGRGGDKFPDRTRLDFADAHRNADFQLIFSLVILAGKQDETG